LRAHRLFRYAFSRQATKHIYNEEMQMEDKAVKRTLSYLFAGLFGFFVLMIVLARSIVY